MNWSSPLNALANVLIGFAVLAAVALAIAAAFVIQYFAVEAKAHRRPLAGSEDDFAAQLSGAELDELQEARAADADVIDLNSRRRA